MTFGTPTLKTPKRRNPGRKHDCGKYGYLTAREIAAKVGIGIAQARNRIRSGLRGDALVAPAWSLGRRSAKCKRPTMVTALRVARLFPDHVPSRQEIMAKLPMSDAAAGRWQQALRDAREVA